MHPLIRRLSAAIGVALITSLVSLASANPASADDADTGGVTWMVRPSDGTGEDGRSWIELELDPGQTAEEHMLIRNLSAAPVTFRLTAADGYFTDTGRFNMLTSDQESVDAGTWIDIQPTVDVPSGADVVVPFTVTVPENATPGDHPAGVAASIRSGEEEQIGVESRVGFRVMTRVAGELDPSATAQIEGGYGGSWNPFEPGRLEASYTFSNTGNTRLSLEPNITLRGLFGLVSLTLPAEEIVEMAPGEERSGTITFRNVWPVFVYTAEVTASTTVVVTGEETPPVLAPVSAAGSVVAFPWAQLMTLLIAGPLLWWVWMDRRRRERRLTDLVERAREEGRRETRS